MRGIVAREMFVCVPEIDFTIGSRYFLNNLENYTRALLATLKSIKSKLPILQSMAVSEEYEGLRIIAQTLKKMTGNIGANGIAEETYQLEVALLNADYSFMSEHLVTYVNDLIEFSDHLELLFKQLEVKISADAGDNTSSFLNYDFTKTKESIKLSSDLIERKII